MYAGMWYEYSNTIPIRLLPTIKSKEGNVNKLLHIDGEQQTVSIPNLWLSGEYSILVGKREDNKIYWGAHFKYAHYSGIRVE